eukprot:TRINITY_DN5180_c0_g2_i3.p1 TRINITY_DN5180_c0_g2~~TRINITY_DN5180_c0_g2_i3.p1  ORF type:complete len:448 (+),score=63.84 TRINITY_DN5180_c0_g2_i3:119-1345(+)
MNTNFRNFEPITAPISAVSTNQDDLSNCKRITVNMTGKIGVSAMAGGCSIEQHILYLQEAGAVGAIIIGPGYYWILARLKDQSFDKNRIKIPAVCIHSIQARNIVEIIQRATILKYPIPNVTMSLTPNKWLAEVKHPGFLVFKGFALGWTSLLIILTTVFWFLRVKIEGGILPSASQMVCIFEWLSAIFRLLFLIDPFGELMIYNYQTANVFLTFWIPLKAAGTIFLAFFFFEILLAKTTDSKPYLTKFKIPFLIYCGIVFIFEIINIILRAIWKVNEDILYVTIAIYSFLFFATTIFFFVGGIFMLKRMNKFDPIKSRNARMVFLILLSSIGLIILTVGILMFSSQRIVNKPSGWFNIFVLLHLGSSFAAYGAIFSFKMKNPKKFSSSSTKGGSNKDNSMKSVNSKN